MSNSETKEAFFSNAYDFGEAPLLAELTAEDRKLAAFLMAVNAAVATFIVEGIIPRGEQVHFMAHLQDFAARIYGGEAVKLPGVFHTMKLESQVGELFAQSSNDALINGHENFLAFKQAVAEITASRKNQSENDFEQEEQNINVKRTLN